MTPKTKSPDPSATVATSAAKAPRRPRKPAVETAPEPDVTLPTITARLLAIAAMGEASGVGPMLSLARAALMDAAKLNGLAADGKTGAATLEDMLGRLDAEDDGGADAKPGDPAAAQDRFS